MARSSESERLAVLETQMQNIETKLDDYRAETTRNFNDVKSTLAQLAVLSTTLEVNSRRIGLLEARMNELESKRNFFTWIVPVISAVLSSAVTFLLISYLQHR